MILDYEPPYDWFALLKFFAARAIPGVEIVDGQSYRRTLVIGRGRGVVSIAPSKSALMARIVAQEKADAKLVRQKLRRLFDLDAPGKAIAVHLRRDDGLEPSLTKRPGLRVPGVWDPFELGVRAILGQQVSVAAASTLAGRIAAKFGKRAAAAASRLTHLFPKPEDLADADLNGIGLTTRRAATIRNFACALCNDATLLDANQRLEVFVDRITELPGLGPWTAHYMAMRLGYADAFPASDLGVRKALNMTSDKDVLRRAEAWRPYRAYATMHLWASLGD